MAVNSQNQDRTIIQCPFCESKLRVPLNQEGTIHCPKCKKDFMTNTYHQPKQYDVVLGGQNSPTTHPVHPSSGKAIFSSKILSQSDPIYAEEITAPPQRNTQWVNSPEMDLDIRILKKKIIAYQIRWFSGSWSGWYVPGVNDLYQKAGEPLRRVWATFNDHHHRYLCIPLEHQTQIRKFNELDQGLVPSMPGNSGVKFFEGAVNPNPQWMMKSSLNRDIALTGHKIIAYKIQKIDGNWSGWIVPGYQDTYQASDQKQHRWWAYFHECRHQYLYMEVLDRNLYVLEESDPPKTDDVVVKGKNSGRVGAVVLGGIDALKQRFKSPDESVRLQTLTEALNYKSQGLDFLKQALNDESDTIQKAAYLLLRNRTEPLVQEALTGYNYWRWLECIHTIEKKELTQEMCIAISTDGKTLVGGNWQGLKIRKLPSGNLVKILEKDLHPTALAISPDHRMIVSGCLDKTIKILDFKTGSVLKKLEGHSSWVRGLAMSLDGKILVSSGEHIKIWDLETGTLLRTLKDFSPTVYCVAISPDAKTVISSSSDQMLKFWDFKTGTVRQILQGHLDGVRCIAMSPDNRTVVSGSCDRTIKIWDLETGTLHRTLQGHSNSVNCLAINQTVISNSQDGVIKIWGVR